MVLRRLSSDDLSSFQAYRHDEALGRYQGWRPQPDAEARAFLEQMGSACLFPQGEWVQIGIADRHTRVLIGDIGVCVAGNAHAAEMGFTLSAPSQGRGLATEAVREAIQLLFEHTHVAQVVGITDARNTASIRVLERVGMRRIASEHSVFRGEACVEHTYAVFRQDGG